MRRGIRSGPAGAVVAAAGAVVLAGIILHLLMKSFTPFDAGIGYYPEYEAEDAAAPAGSVASPREWGSALDDTVVSRGVETAAQPVPSVDAPGVRRLLETALDNPVNKKVSLYMAGKTLERLEERAVPGSPAQEDVAYVRSVFDTVRSRLETGRIDEAGIKRAVPQLLALAKDRRLTPAEFDRAVLLAAEQLDTDIRPDELRTVLERMREPAHRAELQALVRAESGALARAFAGNPVSRRLGAFIAGEAFDRYETRICAKLPPELSCAEARRLFETTMQHIVKNRINDREVEELAGRLTDMLIDRRLTVREVEQLVVFIRQVAM